MYRLCNIFSVLVVVTSALLLCGCGNRYPEGKKPDGALARDVTTEIDRMIGLRELPVSAIAPEGNKTIEMETGPELKGGGYAMTVGEGGRIRFINDVKVEGTTFKTGDELVKRNGWWCPAKME